MCLSIILQRSADPRVQVTLHRIISFNLYYNILLCVNKKRQYVVGGVQLIQSFFESEFQVTNAVVVTVADKYFKPAAG